MSALEKKAHSESDIPLIGFAKSQRDGKRVSATTAALRTAGLGFETIHALRQQFEARHPADDATSEQPLNLHLRALRY